MIKEVNIGGRKCRLKSSAAIPRIYREKFGEDLIVGMSEIFNYSNLKRKLNEELKAKAEAEGTEFEPTDDNLPAKHIETLENFAYILHKHGDPSQSDDVEDWLEQYDLTDIYDIFPELINIWIEENKQTSTAKKKSGK